MNSSDFGWNVLCISVRSNWSNVPFKATISLLVFYLDGLSIDNSGVLKPPVITVVLSISPFMSINFTLSI